MLKVGIATALSLLSFQVLAASPVIKSTPLICGALSCRTYSLEKAVKSGTLIRITECMTGDGNGNDLRSQPCLVRFRTDVTKGSVAEAVTQFDAFVNEDDGD